MSADDLLNWFWYIYGKMNACMAMYGIVHSTVRIVSAFKN